MEAGRLARRALDRALRSFGCRHSGPKPSAALPRPSPPPAHSAVTAGRAPRPRQSHWPCRPLGAPQCGNRLRSGTCLFTTNVTGVSL
uniref:Uncharacterized protein n=1 Tax=Tetraselmis sp. GSL018 TaxID=582737 RepID=A0A061RV24_9CHLO